MKHIKKIATYAAVGGFGAIIMAGLAGCGSDDGGNENALNEVAQKNGALSSSKRARLAFIKF